MSKAVSSSVTQEDMILLKETVFLTNDHRKTHNMFARTNYCDVHLGKSIYRRFHPVVLVIAMDQLVVLFQQDIASIHINLLVQCRGPRLQDFLLAKVLLVTADWVFYIVYNINK